MNYSSPQIAQAAELIKQRFSDLPNKADILKASELKALFEQIKTMPVEERAVLEGIKLTENRTGANGLKPLVSNRNLAADWCDSAVWYKWSAGSASQLLPSEFGSIHPLMAELETVLDIFYRMGFRAVESREIDDDYHMFGSLNFPEGHPARMITIPLWPNRLVRTVNR